MNRTLRGTIIGMIATLALSACGGGGDSEGSGNPLEQPNSAQENIVVGSANFPENQLLAEIYAKVLEAKGIKVTKKLNIGAREIYYDQIKSGAISVMPEYNGALLTTSIDKNSPAVTTDEVNAELKAKLPPTLELLNSSRAENKDSVTVTQQTASKYNLKSIADLKPVAQDLTIGGASEFKTRTQGLVGLEKKYGLKFKKFQSFDANAQVTVVKLLKENKVQAGNLFTTDPAIAENNFVVLADPQHVFSAQNVTPLVYKSAVNDTARTALNEISAKLTTQDLLDMMKQILTDKKDPDVVATEWVSRSGLA